MPNDLDIITLDTERPNSEMWKKQGKQLETTSGKEYRRKVLKYSKIEDSSGLNNYQPCLMKGVGFKNAEILHINRYFGTFGSIKQTGTKDKTWAIKQ